MSVESAIEQLVPVAVPAIANLIAKIARGELRSNGDVARELVGVGMQLVPYDELRGYLTETGKARGEIVADVAEMAKFGVDEDS